MNICIQLALIEINPCLLLVTCGEMVGVKQLGVQARHQALWQAFSTRKNVCFVILLIDMIQETRRKKLPTRHLGRLSEGFPDHILWRLTRV